MASSDEDHNYFSPTRQRLPDYHTDSSGAGAATATASTSAAGSAGAGAGLETLSSRYYRQSQQYSTAAAPAAGGPAAASRGRDHGDSSRAVFADGSSPDPHEFYRQYRESFRRGGGNNVYGALGGAVDVDGGDMNVEILSSRHLPVSTRDRAQRLETRLAQSPSSKPSLPPLQTQRGRQTSLQALVAKFNQSPDEVPPLPPGRSRTGSPSSATQSPSGTGPPRSFRRRISSEGPGKRIVTKSNENLAAQSLTSSRRSPDSRGTREPSIRRREVPTAEHRTSPIAANPLGSHSMTDLSPRIGQIPDRPLLFGEIAGPSSLDPGFGIPVARTRRGSEGSTQVLNQTTKDLDTPEHVSPSSPTAWYKGVTPSLEGIDLSKPIPTRPSGLHRRSHSEVTPGYFASHNQGGDPGAAMATLTPPQEQITPTASPRTNKVAPFSRIPISSRHTSAELRPPPPSFASREAALPSPLKLPTPERPPRATGLRKSPNNNGKFPQSSSQLPAFVSAPPSVQSPPLRSSRPRQPVSTASTHASRARTVASTRGRPDTDKPGKPLPELGSVDLAARRERIQRAFTTKVKEREIETEKKRASLILEARMQKTLQDKAPAPERENPVAEEKEDTNHAPPQNDALTSRTRSPEKERTLTINTGGPEGKRVITINDEDSPTLGTASFIRPGMLHDSSSEGDSSSHSPSSSEETFPEHDLQMPGSSRNASSQQANAASFNSRHRPNAPSANSGIDLGDLESIQIVLQHTPVSERSDGLSAYGARLPTQGRREVPRLYHSILTSPGQNITPYESSTTVNQTSASTSATPAQSSWSSSRSNPTATATSIYRETGRRYDAAASTDPVRSNTNGHRDTSQNSSSFLKTPLPRVSNMETDHSRPPDSLQAPAISNLKRASASLNDPDDWANTSPSMLDWIHHQALDTPVEERSDRAFAADDARGSSSRLPLLPDIQRTNGGLGIDRSTLDMHGAHFTESPPSTSTVLDPVQRNLYRDDHDSQTHRFPDSEHGLAGATPKRLVPDSSQRSDVMRQSSDENSLRQPERDRTPTESISTDQPSLDKSSISMTESSKSSIDPSEHKRLTRRRNILKELVDTESSFGQDMTVVVDIYKGTSNVILNSPDDVKVLFGNSAEIVQFSMAFLDSLKQACKPVYLLPKSKRWKSKRESGQTSDNGTLDDQTSTTSVDQTDDDRDRATSVGVAFDAHMTQMEKVYTEYLKNHEAANQRLEQLQKSEKVKIWLKECRAWAHDLTTAWDLDSLLVKPVQRILKYPLLLKELVEVTPENHPDFVALDTAAREMVGLSKRINEAKRRADLVGQVNNAAISADPPKKRKDTEGRLALSKAFGRRADKVKQQLATPEHVQDRAYNAVADKFGSHFFQLQVVMRDVEMYVTDCQNWVAKLNDFVIAIEGNLDVGQTSYTELESKWRRFRQSMRDMQNTALTDHIAAVRRHVVEPMTTLLRLHDGPQRLMEKRKKRISEYAKFKAIRDRGEKPDKKTAEQGEQFIAVNDTLKEELPKLFTLTGKLVEACLQNFVQLQMQWLNIWKAKLRQAIDASQLPESFAIICDQFIGDFRYTEAQVLSLALCNGSLLADSVNFVSLLSPDRNTLGGSTLNDDSSSRRPSYATDESRSRTTSITNYEFTRNRGMSVNSGQSPSYMSNDYGRAADGSSLPPPQSGPPPSLSALQPNSGRRVRASSVTSRSPISSADPYRPFPNPAAPSSSSYSSTSYMNTRQRSASRTGYDSQRPSYEGYYTNIDRLIPDNYGSTASHHGEGSFSQQQQQQQQQRQSGVFSSAMPMSDSPRAQSPPDETFDLANLNVLFLAASVYEFNIDRARREAGYPYLTYVAGEIFDVIGEKGELWLAKNQDDDTNQIGWIWNKHFAKLAG